LFALSSVFASHRSSFVSYHLLANLHSLVSHVKGIEF